MNKIIYRYARHHISEEEEYTSLDELLSRAWGDSEFGEAYGKEVVLKKTGEIILDHDTMIKLANMLCQSDYDE